MGSSLRTSSSSTNLLSPSPRTSLAESRTPAPRVLKHRSSCRSVQAAPALAPPGPPPSTALPQLPPGPPPSTALPQVPGLPPRRTPSRDSGLAVPSPSRIRSLSHSSSTPILKNRTYGGSSHAGLNLSPSPCHDFKTSRAGPSSSPSAESYSQVYLSRTLQKRPSASGLPTLCAQLPVARSYTQDSTTLGPYLGAPDNAPRPSFQPPPPSQSLSPPPRLQPSKLGIDQNQYNTASAPVVSSPTTAPETQTIKGTTKPFGLHQAGSGLPTSPDSVPVRSLLDEVRDEGFGGWETARTKSSLRFSKLRNFSDRFQLRRRVVPEPAPSTTTKRPPSTRTAGSA